MKNMKVHSFVYYYYYYYYYYYLFLPNSFRRDLKTELFIRAYHQHARDCL